MFKLSLALLVLLSFNSKANEIEPAGNLTDPLSANQSIQYQSLAELEWKYRLILARSNDAEDITSLFDNYSEAVQDRKIAWFVLSGNKLHSNISKRMGPSLSAELKRYISRYKNNDMVLIGYDGEAKSVDNVYNISNFFDEIDSMPIRQYEMSGYTIY